MVYPRPTACTLPHLQRHRSGTHRYPWFRRSSRCLGSVTLLVALIPLLCLNQLFGRQAILPAPRSFLNPASTDIAKDSTGIRPEQRLLLHAAEAQRLRQVASASSQKVRQGAAAIRDLASGATEAALKGMEAASSIANIRVDQAARPSADGGSAEGGTATQQDAGSSSAAARGSQPGALLATSMEGRSGSSSSSDSILSSMAHQSGYAPGASSSSSRASPANDEPWTVQDGTAAADRHTATLQQAVLSDGHAHIMAARDHSSNSMSSNTEHGQHTRPLQPGQLPKVGAAGSDAAALPKPSNSHASGTERTHGTSNNVQSTISSSSNNVDADNGRRAKTDDNGVRKEQQQQQATTAAPVLLVDGQMAPPPALIIPPGANMSHTARLQREHDAALRARPLPPNTTELAALASALQQLLTEPDYQHPEPERCQQAAALHALLAAASAKPAQDAASLQHHLASIHASVVELLSCYASSLAATRRYAVAVLWHTKAVATQAAASGDGSSSSGGIWGSQHQHQLELTLSILQLLNQESQYTRAAMEYTHISKTGGTTMCALAGRARCLNPQLNEEVNCMIKAFNDDPVWSMQMVAQVQEHQIPLQPFCVYSCPQFEEQHKMSCAQRRAFMANGKWNFYSNEQPVRNKGDAMRLPPPRVIHYAQPPLASPPPGPSPAPEELPQQLAADPLHRAALCPDMVHAIMLREPVSHVQSAINELILTYVRYIQHHREFANFVLHKDLEWVTQAAPALVENFQVRSLLGRHFLCNGFRNLTQRHLRQAQAMLSQYDAVMVLDQVGLDDAILAHGLGWTNVSLAKEHRRPAAPFSWAHYFQSRPVVAQLRSMNSLDAQLHEFASLVVRLDGFFFNATGLLQQRWREAAQAGGGAGGGGAAVGASEAAEGSGGAAGGSGPAPVLQEALEQLRHRAAMQNSKRQQGSASSSPGSAGLPAKLFQQYESELLASTCGYVGVRYNPYYAPPSS